MSATDPDLLRLRKALHGYRTSLIDMGGRNRLLNFRHTKVGTLEITAPQVDGLLRSLGRGADFASLAPPAADAAEPKQIPGPGIVTQKATQAALDASLSRLARQSRQMYNDYGLWVLWLGIGMLEWREENAQEASQAPLLLVPVELRPGRDRRLRLHAAEDQDRVANPALGVRLDHMGIDWSPVADADPAEPEAVLAAARSIAATQEGWAVRERAILGLFSSHKEAMYQDLLQNEDRILNHPLMRAIALGPDAGLPGDLIGFEPPDIDRIDELQLPEHAPLVLDADASQRRCVAAALDGRSFVMNGPPGTGKSQTITNIIAALMHAGRSVLFVSEKAAALDVVRNRLREVGLGDLALALHSGDTSRKAVATELDRVLNHTRPVTGAAAYELVRARELREALSGYAAAMNQLRQPLNRTLHDVLGRLVRLEQREAPRLTLPLGYRSTVRGLRAESLHELHTATQALSRAWRPVVEGSAYVWRGLVGASAPAVLAEAADALTALRVAVERRPFAATAAPPRTLHDIRGTIGALRQGLPALTEAPRARDLPEDVAGQLARLAEAWEAAKPETPDEMFALLGLTDLIDAPHRPPAHWFDPEGLERARIAAGEFRRALAAEETARSAAEDVFTDEVRGVVDLPAMARRFAEQHRGLFARFSDQYKADREAAARLTRERVWNRKVAARLDQAVAWREAAAEVARLAQTHQSLLGRYTPRTSADLAALDDALATAERAVRQSQRVERRDTLADHLADGADGGPLPRLLADAARAALRDWCAIAEQRAERWAAAAGHLLALFDDARLPQLAPDLLGPLDQAEQVLNALQADPTGPEEWRAYRDAMDVLSRHGVGHLVARAVEDHVPADRFPDAVEYAVLKSWADDLLDTDARLRTSRASDLDALVAEFREVDKRLVQAAAGAVIEECNARRPRNLAGGAAGVIARQAQLKRRHMPVRELLGRTRDAVRAIKPCFMMSPLTVSQFLPPDYRFDIVIFDEASQVRPADAINCVYRAGSLIVAGDENQLPPTSFFDSAVGEDGDEYDADVPDAFESLLDACKAGALNVLPLRWHYRSRHEGLITFSNRRFYENSLITFPGARDHGDDAGVAFLQATGAVYDRGGRRDNRAEAELLARRVIHHFDSRPARTLGVVALSQAQASAIEDALQQARQDRPDLDRHFTDDRLDGFFVKSLENVQGDERDVMILSVGYGPDETGRIHRTFGPVAREGGWRRLNVAITRARYRTEVVASFAPGALDPGDNKGLGELKRYLDYAQKGVIALARDVRVDPDAEPESPFEESVLHVLREWGYEVQPQVGVAGYRIDLGVRHADLPGTFVLGVECDGAMYHSSKAARDRDRLREQVLTGLGWRLHRIWGTDWYRGRAAAMDRLRTAVERAAAEGPLNVVEVTQEPPVPTDTVPVALPTVPVRAWSAPYAVWHGELLPTGELHEPEARSALRRLLPRVIETEGPVHEDLLVQRARELWGLARAGTRIRANIQHVLQGLQRAGRISGEGDFWDLTGRVCVTARRPSDQARRPVGRIAPVERQVALRELAAECPGASGDELVRLACEFFGWARLGQDIRAALHQDLAALFAQGALTGDPGRITAT
ncbi:DUF3320 domain-containing protein [Streptomyces sp. DSM 44917]|uniref:DUF3320 domain-containing protein n=1 Tax=Streptomyces boetiae TaxID=3075541 RepID=A0ABU2LG14_9ACTN|nr:DUF3320 domain-containing protein [Streptomyces sp. DSM 44917]MDT0310183.1 DUF3320 domain-containing protein [Streptomyces sp. DSM 44917]